jgi:hyperosmotically inducible protein
MKTTFVAVTCALCAAACAGSSNPPPAAPTYATAEGSLDSTPISTSNNPTPSTTTTTTTTASTVVTPSTGATSMMAPSTGNKTSPAPTPVATDAAPAPVVATPAPSDARPDADNTRMNTRDRQGTLTPINQGNSPAEIGITASIRRGVMRDSTLSFKAKNVKIITVGTKVTLRGVVASDAERSSIEALARQTAGVTDVDNQLDVKN